MQLKTEQIKFNEYIDIPGTTHRQKLYLELESRVREAIKNIKDGSFVTQHKLERIRETLHILARAVTMKDDIDEYIHLAFEPAFFDIDLVALSNTPLSSIDDLLDYKPLIFNVNCTLQRGGYKREPYIQEHESMRALLNVARSGVSTFFSGIFNENKLHPGINQALWGKTKSLHHVEQSIRKQPTFNVAQYQQKRGAFFQTDIVQHHDLYEQNMTQEFGPAVPEKWSKNGPG